ncbi:hypothetical protein HHE06_06270 [Helicobacter heilmannii]|uniref:hypothetical protein n=1 Tax=Helicobacter heilmannii TaxID=35817 RepID=UPI0006A1FCF6|nr:hypothetical protein [Helicobacter heilmannii]CRF50781.1 hypothetical protein HHE06_06270 [Helicobacter heilmannii]
MNRKNIYSAIAHTSSSFTTYRSIAGFNVVAQHSFFYADTEFVNVAGVVGVFL